MNIPFRADGLLTGLGLLSLRVTTAGLMFIVHGLPKLLNFGTKADSFPDPIGIGSANSLVVAVLAEVGASALVIVGFYTKLASFGLVVVMSTAAFIHHAPDPWSRKELAVVYLIVFISLTITGPGRFSLDRWLTSLNCVRQPNKS